MSAIDGLRIDRIADHFDANPASPKGSRGKAKTRIILKGAGDEGDRAIAALYDEASLKGCALWWRSLFYRKIRVFIGDEKKATWVWINKRSESTRLHGVREAGLCSAEEIGVALRNSGINLDPQMAKQIFTYAQHALMRGIPSNLEKPDTGFQKGIKIKGKDIDPRNPALKSRSLLLVQQDDGRLECYLLATKLKTCGDPRLGTGCDKEWKQAFLLNPRAGEPIQALAVATVPKGPKERARTDPAQPENPPETDADRAARITRIRKGINFMHRLSGEKFVAQVHAAIETEERLYIIQDKCDDDLYAALFGNKAGLLSNDSQSRKSHAKQVLQAVSAVHQKNIQHCDIKLENFLARGGEIQLSDFDMSRNEEDPDAMTFDGTPDYWSPELYLAYQKRELFKRMGQVYREEWFALLEETRQAHQARDAWATGAVLYALLADDLLSFQKADAKRNYFQNILPAIRKAQKRENAEDYLNYFDADAAAFQDVLEKNIQLDLTHLRSEKPEYAKIADAVGGLMQIDPKKRWTVERALKYLDTP